jgi:hypothetical protein
MHLLFGHVSSISYNFMHLCILDVIVYHYSELSALTFVLEFGGVAKLLSDASFVIVLLV